MSQGENSPGAPRAPKQTPGPAAAGLPRGLANTRPGTGPGHPRPRRRFAPAHSAGRVPPDTGPARAGAQPHLGALPAPSGLPSGRGEPVRTPPSALRGTPALPPLPAPGGAFFTPLLRRPERRRWQRTPGAGPGRREDGAGAAEVKRWGGGGTQTRVAATPVTSPETPQRPLQPHSHLCHPPETIPRPPCHPS